ncbi:PIG-L family deacetylase [Nonomuraea sp. N2-4H]|uniref:PIG-L family deacetylase n=1 Tax=Nonomuraea sp. N2-4H TaxID=3128898 RepID=UPI003247D713
MRVREATALSRRLLTVLGALAVFVPAAGTGHAATTTPEARFMQVVAHQDDDLLFMNPDVHDSIQAGMPSVTVFITAGQITGLGDTDAERARNRQRGIQDAYARMAGVPDADPQDQEEWEGDVWTLSGRQVERFTLKDAPQVQLVFMNLRDGQLGWFVWGDDFVDHTIIPQGSQITRSFTYDTQDVINVLSGMMRHYRPTVVRALDPMPEHRGHADHVGATMFARESAAAYGVPLIQLHYRDYNITDAPVNLAPPAIAQKLSILQHYNTYDPFDPDGRESRLYYRWARGTAWAGRDGSGLPHVFVVRSGRAYAYARDALGQWTGRPRSPTPVGRSRRGSAWSSTPAAGCRSSPGGCPTTPWSPCTRPRRAAAGPRPGRTTATRAPVTPSTWAPPWSPVTVTGGCGSSSGTARAV